MRLVKSTTADIMRWTGLIFLLLISIASTAQENSPYSRYGIGDIIPNQNVINRGMGGIAAGLSDRQGINSTNPATYGNFSAYLPGSGSVRFLNTIFEIGAEADIRVLKSSNPAKKFTNTDALFSYLQIGFPLASKKLEKKGINWGGVIGIKPISRINYSIEKRQRTTIDSLFTQYQGSGGLNQFFVGTGVRIKNFNIGFNTGYMFGNKDYNTRLTFINDTVDYYRSNSATKTNYGGMFFNAGVQYQIELKKKDKTKNSDILTLGAYGSLKQKLKANQDVIRETFVYDANSNDRFRIDSVYEKNGIKGTLVYPSSFGAGLTWAQGAGNWLVGADFETTKWSEYSFYNQADLVQDSWTIRAGAQYLPYKGGNASYFKTVKYRAGFNYSPGYLKLGNKLAEYAATVGAGFPLTGRRIINEYVILNTALEVGARGNQNNSFRENTTRFSIGLSMNARWFEKRKYD
jgi:hypothetical protein